MSSKSEIRLRDDRWHITAPPHVMIRLKNLMKRVNTAELGTVRLVNCPEVCKDLLWFNERYPFAIEKNDLNALRRGARLYDERTTLIDLTVRGELPTREFNLALSPRPYQKIATEVLLVRKALLLADVMGLGKSGSAIAAFTERKTLPALVVVKPNLMQQWKREIHKWLPNAIVFLTESTQVKPIPKDTEIIITAYTRLTKWAEVILPRINSVVFDEMQELRHSGTGKHQAATQICRTLQERSGWRVGLTGSPIYNYGDEMFTLMHLLEEDCLGSFHEFTREHCTHWGNHWKVENPEALGSQLRAQGLLLRRSREDVALELPPRTRIVETIDADTKVIEQNRDAAVELARLIVTGQSFHEKGVAAREFDMKLRQITGIAKAPSVAAFARIFLEQGEKVIIFAWHREVYTILENHLREFKPAFYTGSETPKEKEQSLQKFASGESRVMFMSLRSAEGTDGLQAHCHTVIHAELDWSAQVHEQGFCRVYRPGQEKATLEVFLVSEEGSDPTVAMINGVKRAQSEGILNPEHKVESPIETDEGRVKQMALEFLRKQETQPQPIAQLQSA